MAKLIISCGVPGTGKTFWAKKYVPKNIKYVSRDDIRFSLLNDDDDYFEKEDEVWKLFIEELSCGLAQGMTVWADATHLNEKARVKLINALIIKPTEIEVACFKCSLNTAIKRNEQREGRCRVPNDRIASMHAAYTMPKWKEGNYIYNRIYTIDTENNIIRIQEGKNNG